MESRETVKTISQIYDEINNVVSLHNKETLRQCIRTNLTLLELLELKYNEAVKTLMLHRTSGNIVQELETVLWVMGHDLDLSKYSWFNMGAPKIKALAEEFDFAWPENDRIRKMSKGEKCTPNCLRCVDPQKPWSGQ